MKYFKGFSNSELKEWIHSQQDWTEPMTSGLVCYSGKMLSKGEFQYSCYIKQNKINIRFYGKTENESLLKMVKYIKGKINND